MPNSFSAFLKNENFFRQLVAAAFACLILGYLIRSISDILTPFVAGLIGAYILDRPVRKFQSYKIPRSLAAGLVILTLLIVLALILVIAMPYFQRELVTFAQTLPALAQKIIHSLNPFFLSLSEKFGTSVEVSFLSQEFGHHMGDILQWSLQAFINLLSNGMVLANLLSLIILTPIITFYLLKDWPQLLGFLDRSLPKSCASSVRATAQKIDGMLSDYAKGQTIVCFILMVLYSLALSAAGLNQAVLVGILTGFFAFIPFIGMLVGCLVSLSLAFGQFTDWPSILGVASVFVFVPLIEANFLTPRFIGNKIGLHPVWVLFALLAGGNWFGFVGILFALPIAAIVGILARLLLSPPSSSKT